MKSQIKMNRFILGTGTIFPFSAALNGSFYCSQVREVKNLRRKEKAICEITLTAF